MEMVIPNWALGVMGLVAIVVVAAWLLLAFNITVGTPPPENRPAPRGMIEANEQKRIASLRRVADRQRAQDQREAAARISRGW